MRIAFTPNRLLVRMTRLIMLLAVLFLSPIINGLEIHIPSTAQNDSRNAYKIELLELILSKNAQAHSLVFTKNAYSQARIVESLKASSPDIGLYWMGTSAKFEQEMLPIRIPLYRGLAGYRVFIINKDRQADFKRINTLTQLQDFKGAQGIGWSDIEILEKAGLKQYPTSYENIFNMINQGRKLDYFSRSVIEVNNEIHSRIERLPDLKIDEHILLIYPFAMFFFTHKHNTQLAGIIEDGFKKAYRDGSFLRFFNQHPDIKPTLSSPSFKQRTRIVINNPTLSHETANIESQYWLDGYILEQFKQPKEH